MGWWFAFGLVRDAQAPLVTRSKVLCPLLGAYACPHAPRQRSESVRSKRHFKHMFDRGFMPAFAACRLRVVLGFAPTLGRHTVSKQKVRDVAACFVTQR